MVPRPLAKGSNMQNQTGNTYNKGAPRKASFMRIALYHVPQWRAPIKRNYGKVNSLAALCFAQGYSAHAAKLWLTCHALPAHKAGQALPMPPMLALPAPSK